MKFTDLECCHSFAACIVLAYSLQPVNYILRLELYSNFRTHINQNHEQCKCKQRTCQQESWFIWCVKNIMMFCLIWSHLWYQISCLYSLFKTLKCFVTAGPWRLFAWKLYRCQLKIHIEVKEWHVGNVVDSAPSISWDRVILQSSSTLQQTSFLSLWGLFPKK